MIKDADGVHCFKQNNEEIEYRFLKDTIGNHNIDKSMMFYGNFLQCREDQIKQFRDKNSENKNTKYKFPKEFDDVVYALFIDNNSTNYDT